MKKGIILLLIFILLHACNIKRELPGNNCMTREAAIETANGLLKKERIDINELRIGIKDEGDKFKIEYFPKDSTAIGFSAKVIISKQNCSVISMKLYQ